MQELTPHAGVQQLSGRTRSPATSEAYKAGRCILLMHGAILRWAQRHHELRTWAL